MNILETAWTNCSCTIKCSVCISNNQSHCTTCISKAIVNFDCICSDTDKPNIILLNNHVKRDAAPQWHDLGEQLLMETLTHKLNVIGENIEVMIRDAAVKC